MKFSANLIGCALAITLLAGSPRALLAQSPDYAGLTEALTAETAYLNAKLAQLKAKDAVEQQGSSASDAEKEKREQEKVDLINAVAGLAAKLPTGNTTISNDGVATPLSTYMAFCNLEAATDEVLTKIEGKTKGKAAIFVDSIAGPAAGYEYTVYKSVLDAIVADAKVLNLTYVEPQSAVLAAAAITALPAALNAVAGLFRVDTTEKVFDGKLGDAAAVAILAGKMLEAGKNTSSEVPQDGGAVKPSPPPPTPLSVAPPPLASGGAGSDSALAATDFGSNEKPDPGLSPEVPPTDDPAQIPAAGVFLSTEAYAFRNLTDPLQSLFVRRLNALAALDRDIEEKLATSVRDEEKEKKVADLTKESEDIKAKLADLKNRRDLLAELAQLSDSSAAIYLPAFRDASDSYNTVEAESRAKSAQLAQAKIELAKANERNKKLGALRERIEKLFAALRSTEGSPPLLVRVIRDEQLANARKDEALRFVSLKVVASPQSLLTRKSFLGQRQSHSSLVALQYQVGDSRSQLLASGIVPFYAPKEPASESIEPKRAKATKRK